MPIFQLLFLALLACLPGASASASSPGARDPGEVRIAVLAKRGSERTREKWRPTIDYLDREIPDRRFTLVPTDFDDVRILVRNRLVDFVIVNSAIFVDLSVRFGVQRILTLDNRLPGDGHATQFGSVIFTRSDNRELHTPGDLRGRRLAAVHPTSLGGWLMARAVLEDHEVKPGDLAGLSFLETHDAVVHAVLERQADAGVVRTDTLERMQAEGSLALAAVRPLGLRHPADFPLLVSTPLYPEWPLGRLPHVPQSLAKAVAVTLMQLPAEAQAARSARIHGWTTPEDYLPVEQLLKRFALPPFDAVRPLSPGAVVAAYWPWLAALLGILLALSLLLLSIARLYRQLRRRTRTFEENELRFHAMFDRAAAGILHADAAGMVQRVNPSFTRMSEYSEAELTRLNLERLVHPDELPGLLTQFEQLRQGARDSIDQQVRLRRRSGRELWILLTASCIRDAAERITGFVVVAEDIGKMKALERQLTHERNRTARILETAEDGILGLDREGRHTFVNPAAARILGFGIEEMLGQDSHAQWHHTRADGTPFPAGECPISAVLRDGRAHRAGSEPFWRKDGTPVLVNFTSSPVFEQGNITGAVVIFRPVIEGEPPLPP